MAGATINYAESFEQKLQQKYVREMFSYDLTQSNLDVAFINAQTIKLPRITVSGYKDHNRSNLNFNTGTYTNDWEPKKLTHDRDIEFAVDPMDVDETNLVLSIGNIQNRFENEQAIPEKDKYRFSKLFAEATTYAATASKDGAKLDTTALTTEKILEAFDSAMEYQDEMEVPEEGRILYVTPAIDKMLKNAKDITRNINVDSNNNTINRIVRRLDDVVIKKVPSSRMKTKYDFTVGAVPATDAGQINFILIHPSCVIARDKYSYIHLFAPGTDSRTADKYLYQNRNYGDLFLIENKAVGCYINHTPHA